MRIRFQPWQLAAVVILLCAAAVGLAHWRGVSHSYDAAALIECLPPDQSTHVYIDVAALRSSGILDLLAGSNNAEEEDYRKFIEQTGFDYRTDLDAAAIAFFNGGTYLTVRGRFEWKKLADYARAQGGLCRNAVCDMPASTPGRHISFYPLKTDVLAMAVTADERGVSMIGPSQWKHPPQLPPEPVWISAPAFVFSDTKNWPTGAQAFLRPLSRAEQATFAIGPEGQRLQVRLEVACASPESATALASQLTNTTDLLKKMLQRDHMTPNPLDLSGVLTSGTFVAQDKRVLGKWPVERGFLEALASGRVK